MSQNPGNKNSENQSNSGRGSDHQGNRHAEGFEGMNYEQIRQPYNSGNSNNRNRDDIEKDSEGQRRDDM
jgi:hypothetical protein